MIPTELQALLDREGVPMEARAPIRLVDGVWFNMDHTEFVDDSTAELAHVGAMVRWLLDSGLVVWQDEGSGRFMAGRWNQDDTFHAPALTEALAHACGYVAKEKDNA